VQFFGLTITRTKAAPANLQPLESRGRSSSSFWPIVREPFTGAWQTNQEVTCDTALSYYAVFACITLIAADIAKLCLRLVQQDDDGVWQEVDNPAFSPVLRKPNRYQTITKFVECWIVSKLAFGNTYVWKDRDNRGVVTAMYVLDPLRVVPLVTPSGDIYYELRRDQLTGVLNERLIVPAADIIHDMMVPLFHPLIGVSPIYACGTAALQGLAIQGSSTKFFQNGQSPSGMLTAPGSISDGTAKRLMDQFSGKNIGSVVVAGDGLEYKQFTMSAVDAQLIDQLKWTAENVCSCYHVPPYMIAVGPPPPYANIEPLLQQYYSQCIQSLLTNFEKCLDEGLGINQKINGTQYGTEFDIDDLIWMDTATKTKAAGDAIGSGGMSPDEARKKYFGLGPVKGGDTPYMQQQYFSLAALAQRDATNPLAQPPPPPPAPKEPPPSNGEDGTDGGASSDVQASLLASAILTKAVAAELFR